MPKTTAAAKRLRNKIAKRSESRTLIHMLIEHDPGYCPGQSDVDGLYYFTFRNLDGFSELLDDDRELFSEKVKQLRNLLEALFPQVRDFKNEWKRYQTMFREHFIHAKVPKAKLNFILALFD